MLQLTTIFFLISFSLLSVLHFLALKLFLYWRIEWIDIPMHLFGGAVVALGVFTVRDLKIIPKEWLGLWSVLGAVLVVALCWEAFELFVGLSFDDTYYIDTATDIVMGLIGGYIGFIVGRNLRNL